MGDVLLDQDVMYVARSWNYVTIGSSRSGISGNVHIEVCNFIDSINVTTAHVQYVDRRRKETVSPGYKKLTWFDGLRIV